MNDTNRQEAIDKVLILMARYYQYQMPEEMIDLYHLLWSEYDSEDIDPACYLWMKNNKWFPRANEIVEIIERNKSPKPRIDASRQLMHDRQQDKGIPAEVMRKYIKKLAKKVGHNH